MSVFPEIIFNEKLIFERLKKIIIQDMSIKPFFSVNEYFEEYFPFLSLNLIYLIMTAGILGVLKENF